MERSGTVTFLFTDVVGSTERWQHDQRAMSEALALHDATIRNAVETHAGTVFKHTGDGICAVFGSANDAVAAAVTAQAELALPVRMGLHTGEAETRDGDYFGPTLNRAARVMDAGHGGQVLVSSATASLLHGVSLRDLGEHRLKGLDVLERIFQVGDRAFPPLRAGGVSAGNLPLELSTFVGRDREVDSLATELGERRLVTLIGVGGTGKTRLAVETARTLTDSFPDGCWLVELAVVNVDDAVPFAFAAGLGIVPPADGDVVDHLVSRLRARPRRLVVVDNCEHVLGVTADVVERLLAGCPALSILATSREPLMIRGEHLVPVGSLPPVDAARLFLDRAYDEAPALVIDADQERAIAELCVRLDGLPLALELAASRMRAFSPVELVADLEERFRMLVGGRRSRMERHQTMRGTLDWSYDLCSEVERVVFDRLAVFPAPFDLAAARAVAAGDGVDPIEVPDVVARLVDRSLVQRTTATDGTTRYRMLETMRAYGREHLQSAGTADEVRGRHARHVAESMAALGLRVLGPDEDAVDRRLDEYLADALVALDWCIDHDEWEHALTVVSNLGRSSERQFFELITRLHDAAHAADSAKVPRHILAELSSADPRFLLDASMEEMVERGWQLIRSGQHVPPDRVAIPPHLLFNDGGLDALDVDELLSSLQPWRAGPVAARVAAMQFAVRSLVHSGHLDEGERLLDELASLVAGLDSKQADRVVADLRGALARMRHDWTASAAWYARAVEVHDGSLLGVFDLSAAWHLLTARCLAEQEPEIVGNDLMEPWRCYRDGHIHTQRWHGAVATAVALDRLGHRDLADRFLAWARRDDPHDIVGSLYGDVVTAAGLPAADLDSDDDLDELLAELRSVADGLDGPG